VAAVSPIFWQQVRRLRWRPPSDLPGSPDPSDILHVPKILRA
jgi:hypothetical protein